MRTMIHRLLFVLFCTSSAMSAMDTGSGKSEQEEYTIGGTKITHFPAIVADDADCAIFDNGEMFLWGKISASEESASEIPEVTPFVHTYHYSAPVPWYHTAELSPKGTWFIGCENKFYRPGLCIVHRDKFSSSESMQACIPWDDEKKNSFESLRGTFLSDDTLMFVKNSQLFSALVTEAAQKGDKAFTHIYTSDAKESATHYSYFKPLWALNEHRVVLIGQDHLEIVDKGDTTWKRSKVFDFKSIFNCTNILNCVISRAALLVAVLKCGKDIQLLNLVNGEHKSVNFGVYLQPPLAFSPDGKFLACVKKDGALAIINCQTSQICSETPELYTDAYALAWCAAGLFVKSKDDVDIIRFAPIDKQVSNNNNA